MKIYISLPIAILLFIFSANYAINLLEDDAQTFTQQLTQIEEAVQKGNQQKANAIYEEVAQRWNTQYKKWAVLVDHDKLDDINRLLVKIKVDIAQNESRPRHRRSYLSLSVYPPHGKNHLAKYFVIRHLSTRELHSTSDTHS